MATPNRKLRVFLCHATQDKPIVRELYQRLNAEGWIDPWLDEEKLLPGQDWGLEIEKAVELSDAVIVCVSSLSVNKSGYIQKELRKILDLAYEKPEGAIYLIPLRLDSCQLPRSLKGWQYADYFPLENRVEGFNKVLKSLRTCGEILKIVDVELYSYVKKSLTSNAIPFDNYQQNEKFNCLGQVHEMNSDEILFGGKIKKDFEGNGSLNYRVYEFYKWFAINRTNEDEKIFYITSLSFVELAKRVFWPSTTILFSLISIALTLTFLEQPYPLISFGISSLFFIIVLYSLFYVYQSYSLWLAEFYVITSYRIFSTKNIVSRSGIAINESLNFSDIKSYGFVTGFADRLFNTGSIYFHTLSETIELNAIDDPAMVVWMVENLSEGFKQHLTTLPSPFNSSGVQSLTPINTRVATSTDENRTTDVENRNQAQQYLDSFQNQTKLLSYLEKIDSKSFADIFSTDKVIDDTINQIWRRLPFLRRRNFLLLRLLTRIFLPSIVFIIIIYSSFSTLEKWVSGLLGFGCYVYIDGMIRKLAVSPMVKEQIALLKDHLKTYQGGWFSLEWQRNANILEEKIQKQSDHWTDYFNW